MNNRLRILIIIPAILFTISLHAKTSATLRVENQEYINKGGSLPERFNRMGEVFVQALKNEVEDIIDHDKWQEYRLRDSKIYLFISFNKVEKGGAVLLP